jgi:hypothetical protein
VKEVAGFADAKRNNVFQRPKASFDIVCRSSAPLFPR